MLKVLLFSFGPCFGAFNMLLIERSSKKGIFKHLSNHVFLGLSVQKYISFEDQLFLKKIRKYFSFLR